MMSVLDAPGPLPTSAERSPTAATLPPAGPAWYSSVMGTAILATLTQVHAGSTSWGSSLAAAWLALAWLLLLGLSLGFARRVARDLRALTDTVHDPAQLAGWGTVAMATLAVGAATASVVPAVDPTLADAAWATDAVLWGVGTLLGIVTALGFGGLLVGRTVGTPTAIWGLPIVPPMVSATTGAALVARLDSPPARVWMLLAIIGCFFVALSLGAVVFGVVYRTHWRHTPVPLAASASTWIPLGILGQSTAAAQSIAAQVSLGLEPSIRPAVQQAANAYGAVALTLAVPLVGYAATVTVRGFRARMPFSPGWWALTFPIGTLSLGAHLLGEGASAPGATVAASIAWVALVGTWSLCAVSSVRAIASARAVPVSGPPAPAPVATPWGAAVSPTRPAARR